MFRARPFEWPHQQSYKTILFSLLDLHFAFYKVKGSIKIAVKIYKYLVVLFTIGYWVVIVIDDTFFIQKYWASEWLTYMSVWASYFLINLISFSLIYWVLSIIGVFIYEKLIKSVSA